MSAATTLVGRSELCSAIADELAAAGGLITLAGPAGIGKSRVAARICDEWASGPTYFVELAGVTHEAGLNATLSNLVAQGAGPIGLTSFLQRQPGLPLIVLDEAEEIIAPVRDLVTRLRDASEARVLVTSRRTLDLAWEHVVEVVPLEVPGVDAHVAHSAAYRLFIEVASRRRTLTSSERGQLVPLIRLLEGHPMALERAAMELSHCSVGELLARLKQARSAAGSRALLDDALGAAWRRLSAEAQLIAAMIAAFAGGIVSDDHDIVAQRLKLDVRSALDELERERWIQARVESGRTRRTMFTVIRRFVATQLDDDSWQPVRLTHAECIIARADALDISDPSDGQLALDTLLHEKRADAFVTVASTFFGAGTLPLVGQSLAYLKEISHGTTELAGRAKLLLAYIAREQSGFDRAVRLVDEVLEALPAESSVHLRARTERVLIDGQRGIASSDDYATLAAVVAAAGQHAVAHMLSFNAATLAQDSCDLETAFRYARRSARYAAAHPSRAVQARGFLAEALVSVRALELDRARELLDGDTRADTAVATRATILMIRGLCHLVGDQPEVGAGLLARARALALEANRPSIAWEWAGYQSIARIVSDGWTSGSSELADVVDELEYRGSDAYAGYFAALGALASKEHGEDSGRWRTSPPLRNQLLQRALDNVDSDDPPRCLYVRLAHLVTRSRVPLVVMCGSRIRVGDGAWVELPEGPSLRVARALMNASASAAGPLSTADMFAQGWPGQTIREKSRADRVYDVVRRLRRDVFGELLGRGPAGYRIDCPVRVDSPSNAP